MEFHVRFKPVVFLVLAALLASIVPQPAGAQSTAAAIRSGVLEGTVLDQNTGLAIARATVALAVGGTTLATTTTNVDGRFSFTREPGVYHIEISAEGYGSVRSNDIAVPSGETVRLNTTLAAQTTGAQNLRVIGSTSTTSGGNGLQRTTVISTNITADLIQAEGFTRVGDALVTLPGVNASPAGVHGSTIGYSLPLDISGIGSNESQVLIDGHPIGAVGANAFPGNAFYNQAPVLFDFQNSPSDALRNVQVTYGSGAVGLYGVDSIGGIIDQQTIDPTKERHFSFNQGIGSFGKSTTSLQATGSFGKLGYAFVNGVQGTYGEFKPGNLAQIGLLGQDQSSGNLAAHTYTVSGNYLQRDTLGKLTYDFSPATRLTLTGYTATSWADKSGNGDNDYVTIAYQTLVGNNLVAKAVAGSPSTIVGANGVTLSCVGSIAALNDANPNGFCESAQQYANATAGPQGGGPGPWQALRNQDYHARFTTQLGSNNTVTLDGYVDHFGGIYSRTGAFGPSYENVVKTGGFLISDDISFANNDFGFGYYAQNQNIEGSNNQPQTDANGNFAGYIRTGNQPVSQQNGNFFLRDAYTLSPKVGLFFNGWVKHNSVSQATAFDPRLSVVVKPTTRDVVRLTGGRSTDAPFIGLKTGVANFDTATNNIQPACGGLTSVGTATNPTIASVTGTDVELAYGHNFKDDSTVQLTLYNTNLANPIFQSVLPASLYATNPTLQQVISQLNAPGGRYISVCGVPVSINALVLNGPINVAGGRFRGLELGGRLRVNRSFFVDYGYTIQSAAYTGVSDAILQSNPFLINGAQIAGIPLHTGSLGVDYRNRKTGFEARLDGNYVGPNNSYYIGSYTALNGFVRQAFGKYTTFTVGGINILNTQVGKFGYIGGPGRYQAENKFYSDPSFADEAYNQGLPENIGESFGIPPAQITLSVGIKL